MSASCVGLQQAIRCGCDAHSRPLLYVAPKPQFAAIRHRMLNMERETPRSAVVAKASGFGARATKWDEIWDFLAVQQQFESTPAQEVQDLVQAGSHIIVDVRPENQYAKSSILNAINVPLYRKVDFSKPDLVRYVRALALMANGVDPVEPNPNFIEEVLDAAGGKGVVFACEIGGTLAPTTSFSTGKVSRSLLAVFQALRSEQLKQVKHLRGGIFGWYNAGLPTQGDYDATNVGRTPMVVEEEMFSYGRTPEHLNESR